MFGRISCVCRRSFFNVNVNRTEWSGFDHEGEFKNWHFLCSNKLLPEGRNGNFFLLPLRRAKMVYGFGVASPLFLKGRKRPRGACSLLILFFFEFVSCLRNSFWQYFLDPDRRRCISCRSKVKNCFSWSSNQFLTKICYALSASDPGAPRLRCWFIFTSPSLHIGCSHDQRASLSSLFSCPVYLYRTAWFLHRTHPSR